jgi:hypothetical protein
VEGATESLGDQSPADSRERHTLLTPSLRIRAQNAKLNEWPGQIHDAEEKIQLDEDLAATERVDCRVETSTDNRVRGDEEAVTLTPVKIRKDST